MKAELGVDQTFGAGVKHKGSPAADSRVIGWQGATHSLAMAGAT
jgi:hypothetical protein